MAKAVENLQGFAKIIKDILMSDRYVLLVCDGDMGEGKSCFTSKLSKLVAQETGIPFSYDNNMTYLRSDIKRWVDGDADGTGKIPEYSVILADELISMFFRRNWYDSDQIGGIELLNKCRDRHMCVIGNIPNFWDLDSALKPIITFRVHIRQRGLAWVFSKDSNPFADDRWHRKFNEKMFIRDNGLFKCKGFVCQIPFDDWSDADKNEYYSIRNVKRVNTENQSNKNEYIKENDVGIISPSRNIKRYVTDRAYLVRWILKNHKMTYGECSRLAPALTIDQIKQIVANDPLKKGVGTGVSSVKIDDGGG